MNRVQIAYPGDTRYRHETHVRINDLSRADHLGFDALVALINDAATCFLRSETIECSPDGGAAIIFADLGVRYLSEAFHRDRLDIEVAVGGVESRGFDLYFQVTNQTTSRPVALAKIGVLYFDYRSRKTVRMPEEFRNKLVPAAQDPAP